MLAKIILSVIVVLILNMLSVMTEMGRLLVVMVMVMLGGRVIVMAMLMVMVMGVVM